MKKVQPTTILVVPHSAPYHPLTLSHRHSLSFSEDEGEHHTHSSKDAASSGKDVAEYGETKARIVVFFKGSAIVRYIHRPHCGYALIVSILKGKVIS